MPGARNAIETCLSMQSGERLTVITDLATRKIAAALLGAAKKVGCETQWYILEDEAPRPLVHFPVRVFQAVAESDAAISCFQPQEGEIASRGELIGMIETERIRYAHMVWISATIMQQAMRADYRAVDALSRRVLETARNAERIVVTSDAGTHIEATFDQHIPWIKTSGIISNDYWSNLPGGEVWTVPDSVNGTFVVDGAVGDYLCPKYGYIGETPLTLEIENGYLTDAQCADPNLLEDFLSYCRTTTNSDRVGEFAIGTNIGVSQMIGNLLQDEKVPGVHIAFGNTCQNLTGASWTCPTHIDAISRRCDVWADDVQIMADGQFLI